MPRKLDERTMVHVGHGATEPLGDLSPDMRKSLGFERATKTETKEKPITHDEIDGFIAACRAAAGFGFQVKAKNS